MNYEGLQSSSFMIPCPPAYQRFKHKNTKCGQLWWYTFLIPALRIQRQVDFCEFQDSHGYIVRLSQKQEEKKKKASKQEETHNEQLQIKTTTKHNPCLNIGDLENGVRVWGDGSSGKSAYSTSMRTCVRSSAPT